MGVGLLKKGAAYVLSVSLVLGLVPMSAYAESIDADGEAEAIVQEEPQSELPPTEEESVPEEGAQDEVAPETVEQEAIAPEEAATDAVAPEATAIEDDLATNEGTDAADASDASATEQTAVDAEAVDATMAEQEPQESPDDQAEEAVLGPQATTIALGKHVDLQPNVTYTIQVPADGYLTLESISPAEEMVYVSSSPLGKYPSGSRLITSDVLAPEERMRGQNTWVGVKKGTVYIRSINACKGVTFAFHADAWRDYDEETRPIQLVPKGSPNRYKATAFMIAKDGSRPFDYYSFTLTKQTHVQLVASVTYMLQTNIEMYPHLYVRLYKGSVSSASSSASELDMLTLEADKSAFTREGYSLKGAGTVGDTYGKELTLEAGTYTVMVSAASVNAEYTLAVQDLSKRAFPDVKAGDWYEKVVYRAADLGLIAGYDDGRFGPNDPITRGQVAVVLWRMAGAPKGGSKVFPDNKNAKAYYYQAVRWAGSTGVVSGYADGRFGPNDKVTREQLAAMLANYARRIGGLKVTGSLSDFSRMKDATRVSSWARTSVGWCFRNKILSGSNGSVNPKGNATRAEAAKMLVGLYDLVK